MVKMKWTPRKWKHVKTYYIFKLSANTMQICGGFHFPPLHIFGFRLIFSLKRNVIPSIIQTWFDYLFIGVDSIGTVSASLVTYATVQALKPDLIINAGTAGGFKVFSFFSFIYNYDWFLKNGTLGCLLHGRLAIYLDKIVNKISHTQNDHSWKIWCLQAFALLLIW